MVAVRDTLRFILNDEDIALEEVPADHPALVSPAIDVEDAYKLWQVRRAVSLLPDDEREVVRAQHFEGLTHAQIAGRLGIPVGTVKSRSFRAHARLASALADVRASHRLREPHPPTWGGCGQGHDGWVR